MANPIPTCIDDITPGWLTAALRSTGVIAADTSITAVDPVVLGTGEGFAGDLVRLTPTYDGAPGPATMVAKIPTSIDDNRNGSELLGVYEREIGMYRDILPGLGVPVPTCLLYTSRDPRADLGRVERQQKFLGAVFAELGSTRNPFTLLDALDGVAGNVRVDEGLGVRTVMSLGLTIRGAVPTTATVPTTRFITDSGADVLLLDRDAAAPILADFG